MLLYKLGFTCNVVLYSLVVSEHIYIYISYCYWSMFKGVYRGYISLSKPIRDHQLPRLPISVVISIIYGV